MQLNRGLPEFLLKLTRVSSQPNVVFRVPVTRVVVDSTLVIGPRLNFMPRRDSVEICIPASGRRGVCEFRPDQPPTVVELLAVKKGFQPQLVFRRLQTGKTGDDDGLSWEVGFLAKVL
uniref:Uncharacterized protein n=1 Tax=Helianthus annuus TaxID=4232 RepID=A0A251VP60_HELAN